MAEVAGMDSKVGAVPQVEVAGRNGNGVQMATKAGQPDIRNLIMVVRNNIILMVGDNLKGSGGVGRGAMLTKGMVEVTLMGMEAVLEIMDPRVTTTKDRAKMETTIKPPRASRGAIALAKEEGMSMVEVAGEALGEHGPPIMGPSRMFKSTVITLSPPLMASRTHHRARLTELCLVKTMGIVILEAGVEGVATSAMSTTSRTEAKELRYHTGNPRLPTVSSAAAGVAVIVIEVEEEGGIQSLP